MNRKMPYGYQIQNGMIATQSQEAAGVKRIFSLYLAGKSRDQIADALNTEGFCYSAESPKWDKNRVRQALENPRYRGAHDYPAVITDEVFRMAQAMKEKRTRKRGDHPALCLTPKLRCGHCGHGLRRIANGYWRDTLRFHCDGCGMSVTIPDADLLAEVGRQAAEYTPPADSAGYVPSEDTVRLTNAINRGLEKPDNPEDVVSLILQGISARYACIPMRMTPADLLRLIREKDYDRAIQSIAITADNTVTVTFK
mgnify:FL=1